MRRKNIIAMICAMNLILLAGCKDSTKSVPDANSNAENAQMAEDFVDSDSDESATGDEIESGDDTAENISKEDNDVAEESSEAADEQLSDNSSGTKEKEDEQSVSDVDYETIYAPIFAEVLDIVNNGYDFEKEYKYISEGLMEKTMYPGDGELSETVGFALKDVSGDDIPELIIGADEAYGDMDPQSYIYSIFSIKDDQPVMVFEGWVRSSYRWMGDDHFFYSGSGGAAVTIFGENHLNKDGTAIVWDDFYFSDEKSGGEIGIYHNNTGVFDAAEAEELDMDQTEFFGIMDEYEARCKLITWTPIGKYKASDMAAADNDASGSATSEDTSTKSIEECYQEILYQYKEAQDRHYSMEDVESMGLNTELVQHGWPYASTDDAVKYLYYDVDADGNEELIITYYDYIIDIYGYDGEKVKLAFSTPYRGMAELHPDGMLFCMFSGTVSSGSTTWYQYDTEVGEYFPVFQCISNDGKDEYYTFCYYGIDDKDHSEMVDNYRRYGDYPVWIHEWSDMLTEADYEKIHPTSDAIKLPNGERLADVKLPDDYVPVLSGSD